MVGNWTPLHNAAHKNHVEICKLFFEHVKDKNPSANQGWTPFHWAAQEGHLETCKLFIETIDFKFRDGRTSWFFILKKKHMI